MIQTANRRRGAIELRLQELEARERELIGRPGPDRNAGTAIEAKIPPSLRQTLSDAFAKSVALLLNAGLPGQAASCPGGKPDEEPTLRRIRQIEAQAARGHLATQALSGISGIGMGLFGIGLPDIPILIGTLIRTAAQTAHRCGFGTETTGEQLFLLRLLRTAVETGEVQRRHHTQLLLLAERLDAGTRFVGSLDEEIRRTADVLAGAVLPAKFVQGFLVIGAVGGAVNFRLTGRVADYAALVYEKRLLLRRQRTLRQEDAPCHDDSPYTAPASDSQPE